MPKLYCDANSTCIAYYLEFGGSGYQMLPYWCSLMEAEYTAILYGLSEYFLKWQNELDARQYDMSRESRGEFYKVASPADETPRPLPPPVLVCSSNESVVRQLSRQYNMLLASNRLRKLAQQVWQMTQNVDVKYEWIPRAENIAGKMLK